MWSLLKSSSHGRSWSWSWPQVKDVCFQKKKKCFFLKKKKKWCKEKKYAIYNETLGSLLNERLRIFKSNLQTLLMDRWWWYKYALWKGKSLHQELLQTSTANIHLSDVSETCAFVWGIMMRWRARGTDGQLILIASWSHCQERSGCGSSLCESFEHLVKSTQATTLVWFFIYIYH